MTRKEIKDFCDMKVQLEPENEDIYKAIVKILDQEPCDDVVNRKLEELFERVERIEKQIKEDNEKQLKKLKAELDYVKFCCTL